MGEFIKVAMVGDIARGEARVVEAGGKRIALFNIDGTFYAIDDTCTHRGGPLSEGMVMGAEVTCPWHGAVFESQADRYSARLPRETSPATPYGSKARTSKSNQIRNTKSANPINPPKPAWD